MRTRQGRRTIGIRDAKARLSQVLHDVRSGAEWVITERGKPIARLIPMAEGASLAERLRELEANGTIEPSSGKNLPIPPPLRLESGLVRRMLDEDRQG